MIQAFYLFILIVLFLVFDVFSVWSLPFFSGSFRIILLIIISLLLTISLIDCARKRLDIFKNGAFHLTHLGIIVIIIGSLIYSMYGINADFYMPIGSEPEYAIPKTETDYIKLDFGIKVKDFEVQKFDPDYLLVKPKETPDSEEMPYERLGNFHAGKDGLDLGTFGSIPAEKLIKDGKWLNRIFLDNGLVLVMNPMTDKHYRADLEIYEKNGNVLQRSLRINHPVGYSGWRFYLISYDDENNKYIQLHARKDPARGLILAGIWMLILGIAWICLIRKKQA